MNIVLAVSLALNDLHVLELSVGQLTLPKALQFILDNGLDVAVSALFSI